MGNPRRLRTPPAKIAAVVIATALAMMVGFAGATVDFALGYLSATALLVAFVVLSARTFRGQDESAAPRPWWQLTATPASGYVLGALFLLSAVSAGVGLAVGRAPAIVSVGAVAGLAIAAAYVHSSVRLSGESHR